MTREEAIEVYNGLINTKIKEAFEFFAPELAESEDERHRKWILEYLYDGLRKADEQFKGQFNAAIAYLEKQKEQDKCPEYCVRSHCIGCPIYEKQKEQKPVKIDEDIELGLDRALMIVKDAKGVLPGYQTDDGIYECDHAIRTLTHILKNGIEQKPIEWKPLPESMEALLLAIEGEWDAIKPTGYMSRRLEDLYDGLVNTFDIDEKYLGNLPKTEYTEKDIEEIKALKKKIDSSMETKPAEWSEEDEQWLECIIKDYEDSLTKDKDHAAVIKVKIDFLKSLRPQTHIVSIKDAIEFGNLEYERGVKDGIQDEKNHQWKPSEEQIKALYCALNDAISLYSDKVSPLYEEISRTHFDALESLYNDLKKLI